MTELESYEKWKSELKPATYVLELNPAQACIVKEALEEYGKLRFGQYAALAEDLAAGSYIYNKENPENDRKFNEFIERRNICISYLERMDDAIFKDYPQERHRRKEMSRNKYGGINDMPTGWTKEASNKKVYALWFDMLRRCYDKGQIERPKGKAYAGCVVCERWFSLSAFYEDIQKLPGYREWTSNGKMSIDKDLFSRGAKEYSPKTCCFIPAAVNTAEANKRNPGNIRKLHETNKTRYVLSKGEEQIEFASEKEACAAMNVKQCSVASCYRRGRKCKGYTITRAKMDEVTGDA